MVHLYLIFLFISHTALAQPAVLTTKTDSAGVIRIKIAAVGDLMCHESQIKAALQKDGSYQYDSCFTEIAPYLSMADYTMGNLELVLAGKAAQYTGYPRFNAPDTYAAAAQRAGFDMLTTANNHSYDREENGITRTLDVLDSLGIAHTGTARTEAERDSLCIVNVKGIKLGIMALTFSLNGYTLPKDKPYLANTPIDTAFVRKTVERFRALPLQEQPDKIIACLHWGQEYKPQPNAAQKALATKLFESGVDIIFGAHPHVIEPAERRVVVRNGTATECFIIYSMGNFISSQRPKPREVGVIVYLDLEKDMLTSATKLTGSSFLPTYVHRDETQKPPTYQVLPIEPTIKKLTTARDLLPLDVQLRLDEALKETTVHLTTPDSLFKIIRLP